MLQVLKRLRGQYHELDEKKQSRQTQSIDGLRLEKRRKLTSGSSHWGSACEFALICLLETHLCRSIEIDLALNLSSSTKVSPGKGEIEYEANHFDLRSEAKTCSNTVCTQSPLCFHRIPFIKTTTCRTVPPSDSGFFSISPSTRFASIIIRSTSHQNCYSHYYHETLFCARFESPSRQFTSCSSSWIPFSTEFLFPSSLFLCPSFPSKPTYLSITAALSSSPATSTTSSRLRHSVDRAKYFSEATLFP